MISDYLLYPIISKGHLFMTVYIQGSVTVTAIINNTISSNSIL